MLQEMSAIPYHNSLSSWLNNLKSDDIDGGLAADFDGSLSGLGVELGSSTYNMSEALLALPVFKQEQYDQGFQYLLSAATSPATKMNEETLTYLNQGQSYEIKLKRLGDLDNLKGKLLKSIVRVVFHERRLQYMEREQLHTWKQTRQGERILDMDIPLSYGLIEVKHCDDRLNAAELVWDPKNDTGIFIKVNCISTEFTPKKHGGEKGVPFRVQVETYLHDEGPEQKLLHCASCQVKVFKPKGADRKQKTDRDKIEKKSENEKEKYQPSYECTVLTEIPIGQVKSYLEQLKRQQEEEADDCYNSPPPPSPYLPKVLSYPLIKEEEIAAYKQQEGVRNFQAVSINGSQADSNSCSESKAQSNNEWKLSANATGQLLKQLTIGPTNEQSENTSAEEVIHLTAKTRAEDVTRWLHQNRFASFVRVFQSFSGADLLRLSRDDLIQICGLADGIRLNNALQAKTVRPKLTIFVCQGGPGNKEGKRKSTTSQGSPPSQPATPSHSRPSHGRLSATASSPISIVTSTNAAGFNTNFTQPCGSSPSGTYSPHSETGVAGGTLPFGSSPSGNYSPRSEAGPSTSPSQRAQVSPASEGSDAGKPRGAGTAHRNRHCSEEGRAGSVGTTPPIAMPASSKSKRQYREDNEDSEDEMFAVSYSKKQRTRNLQLSRKEVYHAVFLEHLSLTHLKDKLAALFSIHPHQILEVSVQWPSGVLVLATDSVVQNFMDQTRYMIEAIQDDDHVAAYRIYLQAVTSASPSE